MKKIAIIGAGLSGLSLAQKLKTTADVTIFEKASGASGRMATRLAGEYEFDHGAQFFIAKTPEFEAFIQSLLEAKIIERWDANFVEINKQTIISGRQWNADNPHYIGAKRMNQIGKYLAKGLTLKLNTEVAPLKQQINAKWPLQDSDGNDLGAFDWVISTAPAKQSSILLPSFFSPQKRLKATKMLGCFALMLGLENDPDLPWQAAVVKEADISWIALNSHKPGRPKATCLIAQSTNNWAATNSEMDHGHVIKHMQQELLEITGHDFSNANHTALHHWRYANIEKQQGPPYLLDKANQLAACGDWCIMGRMESAYLSAHHLHQSLVDAIKLE